MQKSMYSNDMLEWSKEDRDTFRCYRQDIADTYVSLPCFSTLITKLHFINDVYHFRRIVTHYSIMN